MICQRSGNLSNVSFCTLDGSWKKPGVARDAGVSLLGLQAHIVVCFAFGIGIIYLRIIVGDLTRKRRAMPMVLWHYASRISPRCRLVARCFCLSSTFPSSSCSSGELNNNVDAILMRCNIDAMFSIEARFSHCCQSP